MHVHVAIRSRESRVPYNQFRNLWRKSVKAVLGGDDFEGANVNFAPVKTRVSMSRYMAKYLVKDLDNEEYEPNKRRYWVSTGIESPKTIRLFSPPASFAETFRVLWSEILGVEVNRVWIPDTIPGVPPIFWLSTG